MKALLYAAVEQAPSAEIMEPEILTRYFTKFDEKFFHYCDKELTKINTFYSGKYYLLIYNLIFSILALPRERPRHLAGSHQISIKKITNKYNRLFYGFFWQTGFWRKNKTNKIITT